MRILQILKSRPLSCASSSASVVHFVTCRHCFLIQDLCAILSGLMVATNYKKGQDLIRDRSFADNEEFFQVWQFLVQ